MNSLPSATAHCDALDRAVEGFTVSSIDDHYSRVEVGAGPMGA